MHSQFCKFVRAHFNSEDFIPLHAPTLRGNEEKYVAEVIRSTFVSTVGARVVEFEEKLAAYCGVKYAIAMVNGTAALHMCLEAVGVRPGTEVLTQSLSFVATANAIHYTGAQPIFLDVSRDSLSLCSEKLQNWLDQHVSLVNEKPVNNTTGNIISACVPMHTFGFIGDIVRIRDICEQYNIPLVEDAAEALGSVKDGRHAGQFGLCSALSFNGNKILTTGGGGAVLTDDDDVARKARHLSTTAKVPHRWEYVHDEVGYNYRMPNLNAALGVAQLEQIDSFIEAKRELATKYQRFFSDYQVSFLSEPEGCRSNYWLCAVMLENLEQRNEFLTATNDAGIMTRPIWQPLHMLPAYAHCQRAGLENTQFLSERVVNIPSSVSLL